MDRNNTFDLSKPLAFEQAAEAQEAFDEVTEKNF